MNLASIIEGHPDDTVALVSRGSRTTYGELRKQVAGLRGAFVAAGIEPGDRVATTCANNIHFVLAYLAILGSGAVVVPLNPQSPARELETQLRTVGAKAIVVGPTAAASVGRIDRSALPDLALVWAAANEELPGSLDLAAAIGHAPAPLVGREPGDLAALLFTSGTAGAPRAAMLSHANLMANLGQVQAVEALARSEQDVSLGVLPFFHVFGLNVVLNGALLVGASVVLVERFDPASTLETIARHGITTVTGPPTIWAALAQLDEAPADALAGVRMAVSGAAKLPAEVAGRVSERFGVRVHEGYGLTETSPVVATSLGTGAPIGSIGRPIPGVEVRLVDEDGEDALAGDAGEILVRGPSVFEGYWEDPEATAVALDPGGWLHTGDIAITDDDGYLYIVDRAKDLVIVSGFNVYPAEVEEVLVEHPAIAEAAVVGVAHPHTGEAVKAYVVLEPGATCEEDEIIAFAAERLARYKCPGKVQFVDAVPRGLGGKLLRRSLDV